MNNITEQQLKKLAGMIKGFRDYRHMPVRDIAIGLSLSLNYMFEATAQLRERGMIEPKSDVGMADLVRYRQLDKLMATNPKITVAAAVRAVYGDDTAKTRYKLRYLIEACRADGYLDVSNIHKLKVDPINHSHGRVRNSTLRFIPIAQVEPEALAAFVGICQMNGGRHAA